MIEDPLRARISRRAVLVAGLGAAAAACSGDSDATTGSSSSDPPAESTTDAPESTTTSTSTSTTTIPPVELVPAPAYDGAFPFALGVASGDPDSSSVILWTRLVLGTGESGRMSEPDLEVAWDVAADDSFDELLASGVIDAATADGHSVHLLADSLEPDSWYSYRFRLGEHTSPIGRARTTPEPGVATPIRFGFSSCQNWESGGYAAHRHLADADLDLFVWLGDYIYEYGPGNDGVVTSSGRREHDSPEVTDLWAYRDRYALYRSDPNLQAHHAARPWVVTWDDHEVDNNHAADSPEDDQSAAEFEARRAVAYQAWWEHMPVRVDRPSSEGFNIHRTVSWGTLLDLHMLDGRQHRDPQPTDGELLDLPVGNFSVRKLGPTTLDPDHSMLGPEQEDWLISSLAESTATWNALGNQVYMHGLTAFPGEPATNTDSWDGYHGSRRRLLEAVSGRGIENLVVLSGDFHSSTVANVHTDPFDSTTPVVAAEFMAPAISSRFSAALETLAPLALILNPQILNFSPLNGYMSCTVTDELWTTELHTLADVTDDNSPISLSGTFTVEPGKPGVATVDSGDSPASTPSAST